MIKTEDCPECEEEISVLARRCVCGWQRKAFEKIAVTHDHRCTYRLFDRRCPSLGTISSSLYANAEWWCSGHFEHRGDPRASEAVLVDAERNPHVILSKRRDWRDEAMKERLKTFKYPGEKAWLNK